MTNIEFASKLMNLFPPHSIYLVGGSSRDYLLMGDFKDFDFATSLKPVEVLVLLDVQEYDHFAFNYGTVKAKINGHDIEITTFRKEGDYLDARHPKKVEYVQDIEIDAKRRDFTINALYLDKDNKINDFYHGLDDLKKGIIRMIGDPITRLKEDPVRILRALRFSLTLNFKLDQDLENAIAINKDEIKKISAFRLNSEIQKMLKIATKEAIENIFKQHNLEIDF